MNTEIEIEEIKNRLRELGMKLDALIQDRETLAMMLISERALKYFLWGEWDLHSLRDLKVAYTWSANTNPHESLLFPRW